MSWLFSQALVGEYSAGTSLAGAPSAQLNVMPTLHKFWRNDKTIESSDHSRFGLTSRLLTVDHGAELLTSCLAAFHARTLALPALVLESKEAAADSGPTWRASLARYDQNSSGWKTAQCSLFEDSASSLVTWPRWGSMLNGVSYLRKIPALPTKESESGFWQTPVADDAVERAAGKWNSRGEPKLSAEVKLWPTPTATLASKGGRITPRKGREGGTLVEAVSARRWPTPRANDAEKRGNFDVTNPRNGLAAAARMWPTPTAGSTHSGGTMQEWGGSKNWVRQEDPDLASGQLNPEWVEWLMGWPIGWTELKPLAMDKFQEWCNLHGGF